MDNTSKLTKIEETLQKFQHLFNTYDFYVSETIPDNAMEAIDIGANKYVIFIERKIKETLNEKFKEFIEEQNKAFKEGKGWIDTTENGCN